MRFILIQIVIAAVMVLLSSAFAEIYIWEDDAGGHATSDPKDVPPEVLKRYNSSPSKEEENIPKMLETITTDTYNKSLSVKAKKHSENLAVKIKGEIVKVGQGADIVQSRISADRYVPGNNYGDPSKGYYIDGGITYVITYGTPKSGNGTYVITKIEKVVEKQKNINKKQEPVRSITDYTAISFDTSESELRKKFPRVKCEQMPNPQVRICTLSVNKSDVSPISYLYFSGKLININGRTKE